MCLSSFCGKFLSGLQFEVAGWVGSACFKLCRGWQVYIWSLAYLQVYDEWCQVGNHQRWHSVQVIPQKSVDYLCVGLLQQEMMGWSL